MPSIWERFKRRVKDVSAGSILAGWLEGQGTASKLEQLGLYRGHVHTAISARSQATAKLNFRVFKKAPDGSRIEQFKHPLLDVLNKPNPLYSKYQFLELTQTYLDANGECFWYSPIGSLTGQPKEFYILRPDRMTVAVGEGENGLPALKGYVYTKPMGQTIVLEPNEVVHFKLPNPVYPYRGLGIIEAGLVYIMTEKYGSEYTRNFIFNNALPAGVLNLKGTVNAEEFEKIKRKFNQEYGQLKNAGKTAVIKDAEVEFVQIGSALSEAALKELKDLTRDDILEMFRVPKSVLGIVDDVNRANMEASLAQFTTFVVEPNMFRIVDTLQSVIALWGDYELGFDSPIPEDQEQKLLYYQAGMNNWLTINDIRSEENLPDLEGGDVIRQPIALIDVAAPRPDGQTKSNGTITVKKKSVRKDAPVAAPANRLDFSVEQKENFRVTLMKTQMAYERGAKKKIVQFFRDQEKRALAAWESEEGKAARTKQFEGYLFNLDLENDEIKAILDPLMTELIKDAGQLGILLAGADELEFALTQEVRSAISVSLGRMAGSMNETTLKDLERVIGEAIRDGKAIEEIADDIRGVYASARGYRAELIARTETLKASNYGANAGYKQTGYVVKKVWYANPGACDFCLEFDGKTVGIDSDFAKQGEQVELSDGQTYALDWEDVGTPPLHPNCRCTILPVAEGSLVAGDS